jgi:pilus assembly protein CpaF
MSLETILPFLQPIADLIRDASISEVMVNGSGRIFFERAGRLQAATDRTIREQHLRVAVQNAARVLGEDISEERPILDARLSDGSRVAAVLPPVSLGGTTLTIRKFQSQQFTADELVRIGTLTADQLQILRQAIHARDNILISGGTGTGKTTLLNALVAFMPADDRLALIEDTAELQLDVNNLFRFEAPGAGRLAGDHHSRLVAGRVAASARSHPGRRSPGWGSVRSPSGFEYRARGHALDHSRERG